MPDAPCARILIVDDEAAQMKALCNTLRDYGYETVGFTSGQNALAALRDTEFDLFLTDLMMPEMDGVTLLRAALEADPNLVGILMTGHGAIGTAVEAMKAGALDYILKPFKLSAILPVLSRGLTVRRLRLEKAELKRHLRKRTAELEAANDELEAFASSVAHDLHAPARHVAAYARMVLEEYSTEMNPTAQEHLLTIVKAGERMGRLITDLLAFARLSRSELSRSSVKPNVVVAQVQAELKPEMKDRTIVWKVSDLPAVHADESMLKQVFFNLLSNAIKYTRKQSPAEIEIGSQQNEAGGIVFYVRDNGAGFDMKYVDKLFGVFQRLHPASDFEGTGLGLSIVQRIVQRHGGRTWAEGKEGCGATFYFTLGESPGSHPVA